MKKVISLVLCAVMILSCFSVTAFANSVNLSQKDALNKLETESENIYISFDPSDSGWSDYEKIYCNVSEYRRSWETIYPRYSLETLCTDDDGDGIYTYDLSKPKFDFNDGDFYFISFENDKHESTLRLVMQTQNFTDTVYCNGSKIIEWTNYKKRYIPALKDVVSNYEQENDVKLETYRCYFYLPDGSEYFADKYGHILPNWLNEYCDNIVIYFTYDDDDDVTIEQPPNLVGYGIEQTDIKNLYYADIPVNIGNFTIANDVINQSTPTYSQCTAEVSFTSKHSEGSEMVYVIDSIQQYSYEAIARCYGTWYYYKGDGCYSETKGGKCLNKSHTNKAVSEAIREYESKTGEKLMTKRLYFLMPYGNNGQTGDVENSTAYGSFAHSWYNENSTYPSIYWWNGGEYDPPIYPGYKLEKAYNEGIYYADIPVNIKDVIFSNGVKVSFDTVYDPMVAYVRESEYVDTENIDNMIYVVDPDKVRINEYSLKHVYDGDWYHYYGSGCYGTVKNGNNNNCVRSDHLDKNGVHQDSLYHLGDTDTDSILTIMDATEIQLVLARMKKWKDRYASQNADFDKDGIASIMDATSIQLNLAQIT